ncbi:MAG: hypothetical protein H8E53_07470 [Planctomycetes bacterium]|nr:hypothetical protein [Planctomycetota bacterium]
MSDLSLRGLWAEPLEYAFHPTKPADFFPGKACCALRAGTAYPLSMQTGKKLNAIVMDFPAKELDVMFVFCQGIIISWFANIKPGRNTDACRACGDGVYD